METTESLLYGVFEYLRRNDVPLGISEYQLALRMFREGKSIENLERFRRICRLLWTKSREDQQIFDDFFETWLKPRLQRPLEPLSSDIPSDERISETSPSAPLPRTSPEEYQPEQKKVQDEVSQNHLEQNTFRQISGQLPFFEISSARMQHKPYHFTPQLPLSKREMTALWRHLRRPQRTGPPEELDVEGTIHTICRNGFFLGPTLRPRRRNQAKLVLLIDCQGSMAPFSLWLEILVESIERGGLLRLVHRYYFHDYPARVVYQRPNLTRAAQIEQVLAEQAKNTSVLIVSDAGAARGYYDAQRVNATKAFLSLLNTYTYLYAWLNPMPPLRWKGNTAEEIAHFVPMFSLNRDGLNDAIELLRGHPFPPGVTNNATHP